MVGFSSASIFSVRKQELVTQGGTRGIDHLTRRRTQGAGVSKAGRISETAGEFPIHSRKTTITRARAL